MIYQSQVPGERKKEGLASACCWRNVEDIDHSWVDDVDTVVELAEKLSRYFGSLLKGTHHSNDEGKDERNSELAALVRSDYNLSVDHLRN